MLVACRPFAPHPSLPPGVIGLLRLIVQVVERSVWGYFLTFIFCWFSTLGSLNTLIKAYLSYLADLTLRLTLWPNNLLFVVGLAVVALAGAALILHVVLHGQQGASSRAPAVVAGVLIGGRRGASSSLCGGGGGGFKAGKGPEEVV